MDKIRPGSDEWWLQIIQESRQRLNDQRAADPTGDRGQYESMQRQMAFKEVHVRHMTPEELRAMWEVGKPGKVFVVPPIATPWECYRCGSPAGLTKNGRPVCVGADCVETPFERLSIEDQRLARIGCLKELGKVLTGELAQHVSQESLESFILVGRNVEAMTRVPRIRFRRTRWLFRLPGRFWKALMWPRYAGLKRLEEVCG